MTQETVLIKLEVEWENEECTDDTTEGLYGKHEVKNEVMIGPETLQPRDATYPANVQENSSPEVDIKPEMYVVKGEPEEVTIKVEPADIQDHQLTEEPAWTPVDYEEPALGHVRLVNIEDIKQAAQTNGDTSQFDAETRITQTNTHKQQPKTKSPESYVCNICKKSFKVKSYLMMHLQFHQQFPHTCNKCQKHFMCESTLGAHKCDAKEKPSCSICEKNSGVKNYHCKSHSKKQLIVKRVHTGEKPYFCTFCNKKFSTEGRLAAHARCHTGEKAFSCKTCNAEFVAEYHLSVHERIHTGEKPYSCDICDKRFTYPHVLAHHKRIHTKKKTHCCCVCNKNFAKKRDLKLHERLHTGDKPCNNQSPSGMTHQQNNGLLKCSICDKLLTSKYALANHEMIHKRDKSTCKKERQKTTLKMYI